MGEWLPFNRRQACDPLAEWQDDDSGRLVRGARSLADHARIVGALDQPAATEVPRHDAHALKLRLMVGRCDGWMGLMRFGCLLVFVQKLR